jgi:hypothetical protein
LGARWVAPLAGMKVDVWAQLSAGRRAGTKAAQ